MKVTPIPEPLQVALLFFFLFPFYLSSSIISPFIHSFLLFPPSIHVSHLVLCQQIHRCYTRRKKHDGVVGKCNISSSTNVHNILFVTAIYRRFSTTTDSAAGGRLRGIWSQLTFVFATSSFSFYYQHSTLALHPLFIQSIDQRFAHPTWKAYFFFLCCRNIIVVLATEIATDSLPFRL